MASSPTSSDHVRRWLDGAVVGEPRSEWLRPQRALSGPLSSGSQGAVQPWARFDLIIRPLLYFAHFPGEGRTDNRARSMKQWISTPAVQSLGLQLALTLAASGLLLPFSVAASLATFLGGAIAIAGNLLVVALVFGRYRAAEPGGLTTRMVGAELARLVLVAVGFGLVFVNVRDPAVLVLFGSFLLVHLLPVWWLHRVSDQAMKR